MTKTINRFMILCMIFLLIFTAVGCGGNGSSTDGKAKGKAESGAEFKAPEQKLRNLEAFARLYGYVKYFYPGDEAAGTGWKRFAIYGAKKVENAANASELKKALEELFHPIAPALVIHETADKKTFSVDSITPQDKDKMKLVSCSTRAWNWNCVPFTPACG